ncbi:hypothetical protein GOODEAATRI_013519 [Goodea atripinnis]|uniref:Uncharacterized protein n=1 Tax=Goodea atripinnis TaxID=208336 RepID=A0ABV0NUM5_9TELE
MPIYREQAMFSPKDNQRNQFQWGGTHWLKVRPTQCPQHQWEVPCSCRPPSGRMQPPCSSEKLRQPVMRPHLPAANMAMIDRFLPGKASRSKQPFQCQRGSAEEEQHPETDGEGLAHLTSSALWSNQLAKHAKSTVRRSKRLDVASPVLLLDAAAR